MIDNEAVALGMALYEERKRRGLSLRQAAPLLGVSPGLLSRWERGWVVPAKHRKQVIDAYLEGAL